MNKLQNPIQRLRRGCSAIADVIIFTLAAQLLASFIYALCRNPDKED